jgi:hypothetical protein
VAPQEQQRVPVALAAIFRAFADKAAVAAAPMVQAQAAAAVTAVSLEAVEAVVVLETI